MSESANDPAVPGEKGPCADQGAGKAPRGGTAVGGGDWLTEEAAEVLLRGAAGHGAGVGGGAGSGVLGGGEGGDGRTARSAVRLAGLLAAARETPGELDPVREEAALAAFRAARAAGARPARAEGVKRAGGGGRWRVRVGPRRVAVAVLASVLALGGVTVAVANAGRLLVSVSGQGAGAGPVSSRPSAVVVPDGRTTPPSPTPPHATAAPTESPDGTDTPTRSASNSTAYSAAWCRTYLRGLGKPGDGHRHSRAVTAHCRDLLDEQRQEHRQRGGNQQHGESRQNRQKRQHPQNRGKQPKKDPRSGDADPQTRNTSGENTSGENTPRDHASARNE